MMISGVLYALLAGLMWGLIFVGPLLVPEYPAVLQSMGRYLALGLIALPLVVLCIFKYSGLAALVPDGQSILMISLLAASAPAAANVTQIAQVYGHEGDYAGAINVITTLLCIGTMPLMVLLYQM